VTIIDIQNGQQGEEQEERDLPNDGLVIQPSFPVNLQFPFFGVLLFLHGKNLASGN
jgi:hypothetical protein